MQVPKSLTLWLPVALYVAFIFWLSSAPRALPGARIIPRIDKLYHFAEYLPLGLLMTRAVFRSAPRMGLGWIVVTAMGLVAAVAGSDEMYQRFIDTRISSSWDALADLSGSALGSAFYCSRTAKTP